jgi:hypothetical protein
MKRLLAFSVFFRRIQLDPILVLHDLDPLIFLSYQFSWQHCAASLPTKQARRIREIAHERIPSVSVRNDDYLMHAKSCRTGVSEITVTREIPSLFDEARTCVSTPGIFVEPDPSKK